MTLNQVVGGKSHIANTYLAGMSTVERMILSCSLPPTSAMTVQAPTSSWSQGCQMAKFDPFLSLDCARVEGVGAQSKERKGSNFAA